MSYTVEVKFKQADGYSEEDSFIFNYELDDDGIYSTHSVDTAKTGWTTEEIIDILASDDNDHPAILFLEVPGSLEIVTEESEHPNSPNSSAFTTTPVSSPRGNVSDFSEPNSPLQSEVNISTKNQSFFNQKNQLLVSSILVLDSMFLVGLAIAGLLNTQHLALIMIGLVACSAIAAASTHYFSPKMD